MGEGRDCLGRMEGTEGPVLDVSERMVGTDVVSRGVACLEREGWRVGLRVVAEVGRDARKSGLERQLSVVILNFVFETILQSLSRVRFCQVFAVQRSLCYTV